MISDQFSIISESENCWKYIPINNPNESFTLTKEENKLSETTNSRWIYRPSEESNEMTENKKKLDILKDICDMLPKIKLPIKYSQDYPVVLPEALSMYGLDYDCERPIFVIGGIIFCRRYNDNWSGSVIVGKNTFRESISWDPSLSVTKNFLEKLKILLTEKPNPSNTEVMDLFTK